MRRNGRWTDMKACIFLCLSAAFLLLCCFNPGWAAQLLSRGYGVAQAEQQTGVRKLALLVGINKYQYEHIGNLNGAVNDVSNMQRLLVERFDFPDDAEHIRVLTDNQATREAILKSIEEHLIAKADRNSIVVFHYSGHGSYRPDDNGDEIDGRDETIVPYDSGHIDPYPNRDITDDELNELLGRVAEMTPYVTFIFDSCHSGTAVRGAGLARTTRPDERPSAATERHASEATRGVSEGRDDLRPMDARYALISAAMAQELSYEMRVDGQSYGALTWTLADELRRAGADTTYRDIIDVIRTRVTARYPSQHPQLEGPGEDQFVFNSKSLAPAPFVSASPRDGDRVRLEAGQVHGVTEGSVYVIYPPGTKSFARDVTPVAKVKVGEVDLTSSSARVINGRVTEAGSRAVEREHHWPDAVLRVYFQGRGSSDILQQIRRRLLEFKHVLVLETPGGYDLLLREQKNSNDGKRYIVTEGGDPTEISPRVPVTDPDAVPHVVEQVTHWAKWFNILRISNTQSELGVDFKLQVPGGTRVDAGGDATRAVNLSLVEGERFTIAITNTSRQNLYIALLDLSSDGSVELVYPVHGEQEFVAPGKTWSKHLETFVPPGQKSVRDVIKLIATTTYADFSFLQQGAVRGGLRLGQTRGNSRNSLEELLANASMGTLRGVKDVDLQDWVTVDRILEVHHKE